MRMFHTTKEEAMQAQANASRAAVPIRAQNRDYGHPQSSTTPDSSVSFLSSAPRPGDGNPQIRLTSVAGCWRMAAR
jgi:hypothetical protein